MKLYFAPGACSLSPHIALIEAGLPFTLVQTSTTTHLLKDGTSFYTINPLGYVPVLELDDGKRLREGPAIVQYIADQAPASKLAPPNGTFDRYVLQEWLAFISTEVHKGFGPLWNPAAPDATKQAAKETGTSAATLNLVAKILQLLHSLSLRRLIRSRNVAIKRHFTKTLRGAETRQQLISRNARDAVGQMYGRGGHKNSFLQ